MDAELWTCRVCGLLFLIMRGFMAKSPCDHLPTQLQQIGIAHLSITTEGGASWTS